MESTQRLPEETDAQWLAYCCYRDLGIARTPRLAYEKYLGVRGQSEASKSIDRKITVAGSFAAWKNRFHWDERTREWDLGEELRQRFLQRSIDDQKYQADLEQFRQSQMTSGRIGVKTAITLKQELLIFVEKKPAINTWAEALAVARILSTLEIVAAEQWAKSLHVDRLLEQMSNEEQYQD